MSVSCPTRELLFGSDAECAARLRVIVSILKTNVAAQSRVLARLLQGRISSTRTEMLIFGADQSSSSQLRTAAELRDGIFAVRRPSRHRHPSPCHHAEFLGGVLKQQVNLIKTISIDVAKVLPGHTGLVQPDILAAEDVDRIFGSNSALPLAEFG